jgi:cyclophilin family peptidyl-prolyl cis-trans isomerase
VGRRPPERRQEQADSERPSESEQENTVPSDKRQRQREGQVARRQAMQAARKRQARRNQLIAMAVILAVIAGIAFLTSAGSKNKKSTKLASTNTSTSSAAPTTVPGAAVTGETTCPKADGSSPRTTTFAKVPPMCIDPTKTYTATIETDAGTMTVALDAKKAPKTVNNFVVLARYHYFDGIVFHRVIPGFVVQGGDPQGTGAGGPGYKFDDELPKAGEYKVGSLAMANSGANTNGSQFFIIIGAEGVALPPKYSLFGQVTTGIDVAKKIEADGDASGAPKVMHKMIKVTIAES